MIAATLFEAADDLAEIAGAVKAGEAYCPEGHISKLTIFPAARLAGVIARLIWILVRRSAR